MKSRWEPERRLALVAALAQRSGADSESLMDAYGLGVAYRRPSGSSSKRARINAALHEAERRGTINTVLDAVAAYLGLDEHGTAAASPTQSAMPAPASAEQKQLLQVVWDLLYRHNDWPTFAAMDTLADQRHGLDAINVAQAMPEGLLQPPDMRYVQQEQEVRLTMAGAAACDGSSEELAAFLAAVQLATDLEREPRDGSTEPVLSSAALRRNGRLPAAGRDDIVRRAGCLLRVEPWGWSSSATPDGDQWTFNISRDVRRLREVSTLADYWHRVHPYQPNSEPDRPTPEEPTMTTPETIFLVHGHDDARHEVRRFLERVVTDVDIVMLDEQVNRGRTIIEKFESFSQGASVAVVLLTPDDFGRAVNSDGVDQFRARQNVVFELGYFVGKLGRDRVVVLKKGNIEEPSDVGSVVYIPYPGGDWKLRVLRELKEHFTVDANAAVIS